MNKIQKIWIGISVSMFILPEVFWSPLCNFLYSFFMPTIHGSSQIFRPNFLLDTQFALFYIIILSIQLVGIVVFIIKWAQARGNVRPRPIYWSVLILGILLGLVTTFAFFLLLAVGNMSFP